MKPSIFARIAAFFASLFGKKEEAPLLTPEEAVEKEELLDAEEAKIVDTAEEKAEEEAEEAGEILSNSGEATRVRYNRSFISKLIQASDETKSFYCQLKNHVLSYKGVKERMSWKAVSFNAGRKAVIKMTVRGKTLTVYFPLSPADYESVSFSIIDMSDLKSYASTPLGVKVRSDRAVANVKKLLRDVTEHLALEPRQNANPSSVSDYPYEETPALIEKGLIKVKSLDGSEIIDFNNIVGAHPFALHERVTAEEAHREISDEVALTLVFGATNKRSGGRKFIVNIDTLSECFESGDSVDMETLKAKGIVPQKEERIKILARGTLDKALTVTADAYSADAIKMIVLVGGTAIAK